MELTGTGYIEICPGMFRGKHWLEECHYFEEEAFGVAAGVLLKHFPDYNPFGPNDFPMEVGLAIAEEWEKTSEKIENLEISEVLKILNLAGPYGEFKKEEIQSHNKEIAIMLRELSVLFNNIYEKHSWLCVLGI